MSSLTSGIRERLASCQGLTQQDVVALLETSDLLGLASLIPLARPSQNGQRAIINARRIVYSNVCRAQCLHCKWSQPPGAESAYSRTPQEMVDLAGEAVEWGIDQLQLAGGVDHAFPYDYYLETVAALRKAFPKVHIQAFAPAQLGSISANVHLAYSRILQDLKDAGLDSIREDGADIFDPRIRRLVCYGKASGGTWLQVMRDAHDLGLLGGASMLYGHYEGPSEKAEHLSRLADLQDETGGFTFYAPRAFRASGAPLRPASIVGGLGALREFAVGAIFLRDIPHIRCYADDVGMSLAQVAMQFGVDTVCVLVRDGEPLDPAERAAQGLPNVVQMAGLIEEAGYEVTQATLDQRPTDS